MPITEREAALLNAFRRLPPVAADEISALVDRLAALSAHSTIDWSDEWSEADLKEFSEASLRRAAGDEQDHTD